jgi:hypothetical protein
MKRVPGEAKTATFRTLLRMLLTESGLSITSGIRKTEAMAMIRELAGRHTPREALERRHSGGGALAALLTSYVGREVSLAEALGCFCNPKHRGLLRTRRLDRLLAGRPWPPLAPCPERLKSVGGACVRTAQREIDSLEPLLTSEAEEFVTHRLWESPAAAL